MSLSINQTVYTEVDVDIDLVDVVKDLSASEKAELMKELCGGTAVPFGFGDGDSDRIRNIIERAYLAAKTLPAIPREIADLFWIVHGRALS